MNLTYIQIMSANRAKKKKTRKTRNNSILCKLNANNLPISNWAYGSSYIIGDV